MDSTIKLVLEVAGAIAVAGVTVKLCFKSKKDVNKVTQKGIKAGGDVAGRDIIKKG